MIDICSCCKCCNGCSSTRQLSLYPRYYSFSKKLLVAIALVVLIAMIIAPTEARPPSERHRHRHANITQQWKVIDNLAPSKFRKQPKGTRAEIFMKETVDILQKLRNTKGYFNYKKEKDIQYFRAKPPHWLPKVNFVELHFCAQETTAVGNKERKQGLLERKFLCVIPRLYKSLKQYEALLKHFYNMELNFPDSLFNSYKNKRQRQLSEWIGRIGGTIAQVEDSMIKVNMTLPRYKPKEINVKKKVGQSECYTLDYVAFRGYGNFLNNWVTEIRCLKKRKNRVIKNICDQWESKLSHKRIGRRVDQVNEV